MEPGQLFMAKLPQHASHGLSRRADELRNFLVGQTDLHANPFLGLLTVGRPFQQQRASFSDTECDNPSERIIS